MREVTYLTSNASKFNTARLSVETLGLKLVREHADLVEIQAKHSETVARAKAKAAFELFKKPLVISDDSWLIPGLNGFPGPYMKYMNEWFTIEDWLRLTGPLADRRAILRQIVVYQDAGRQELFSVDIEGLLLPQARGTCDYPHLTIVSMDGGKRSNAEYIAEGKSATAQRGNAWHKFAAWYKEHGDEA